MQAEDTAATVAQPSPATATTAVPASTTVHQTAVTAISVARKATDNGMDNLTATARMDTAHREARIAASAMQIVVATAHRAAVTADQAMRLDVATTVTLVNS